MDVEKQALREIEAVLKKVTQFNRCLICELELINEPDVRAHFLNVHHQGEFVCNAYGCNYVAKTNGDLRQHFLLWHSDNLSTKTLLPKNPNLMMYNSNGLNLNVHVRADQNSETETKLTSLFCHECDRTIQTFTDFGVKLHQAYHEAVTKLSTLTNMDMEFDSSDDLKKFLDGPVKLQYATSNGLIDARSQNVTITTDANEIQGHQFREISNIKVNDTTKGPHTIGNQQETNEMDDGTPFMNFVRNRKSLKIESKGSEVINISSDEDD